MLYKKLFFLLAALVCFSNNASDIRKPSNFEAGMVVFGLGFVPALAIFAGVSYFTGLKPDIQDLFKPFSACFLGTASFVVSTAVIYEVGKRGYIPKLTDYFKNKKGLLNTSFQTNFGKFKMRLDFPVYCLTTYAVACLFGAIDHKYHVFQLKNNGRHYAFGAYILGQTVVNLWAQQTVLPVKYNPFVWTNEQGKSESVLIFPSKWGKPLRSSDGAIYKVLLDTNL